MPRLTHRAARLALATVIGSGAVVFLPVPAAHAAGHQVLMSDYKFGPRTLTIPVGDSVTWVNQDTAPHDVKTTSGPASVHSPMLDKGGTWSHTFTKAGSYGYVCTVHPGMTGGIVVKAAATTRAPAPSTPPRRPHTPTSTPTRHPPRRRARAPRTARHPRHPRRPNTTAVRPPRHRPPHPPHRKRSRPRRRRPSAPPARSTRCSSWPGSSPGAPCSACSWSVPVRRRPPPHTPRKGSDHTSRNRHPWSTGPIPAPSAKPAAMAPVTYSLARRTASGTSCPWARPTATAEARVQPVPWVWALLWRGERNQCSSVPSVSRSTASPGR